MKVVFVCFFLIGLSTATSVDNLKLVTTLKPTSERIKAHGYPAEEHVVKTEDGYLVQMFRIPYSHKLQNQNDVRPAVFIQHGLFSCSDGWIATGPDSALPYLLADSGYDVWMGNARGNSYSRKHVKYSVDNPKFWRFSWHEIAVYDISAMIDYILSETGEKSVHYVGHSQGTTVFFVLMSMLPAYNDKIKTAHMLAPVAYMSRCIDPMVTVFDPYLGHHGIYSALFGSAEFLPRNELITLLAYNACGGDVQYPHLCSQLVVFYGKGDVNTNKTALPIIMETHPAGASTDQILHYMQGASSGDFKQFDFGTKTNKKVYNNAKPPDYEVERISSEVHFYYSQSDTLAAVEDVLQLAGRLPNLKGLNLMADPNWSHTDFSMAYDVKTVINDKIMGVMDEYESDLLTKNI